MSTDGALEGHYRRDTAIRRGSPDALRLAARIYWQLQWRTALYCFALVPVYSFGYQSLLSIGADAFWPLLILLMYGLQVWLLFGPAVKLGEIRRRSRPSSVRFVLALSAVTQFFILGIPAFFVLRVEAIQELQKNGLPVGWLGLRESDLKAMVARMEGGSLGAAGAGAANDARGGEAK